MESLTTKQRAVLAVLNPAEGSAKYTVDIADEVGMTDRGCQYVLYHLADADLIRIDEFGYYLTRKGERAKEEA